VIGAAAMLKLTIANQQVPPVPQSAEVWRDNEGVVCAYGHVLGEEYWMHLPGLASFRFSCDGDEISAAVSGSVREELVLDAYFRRVLPMALQARGREVLHASAVRTPSGVAALCGVSEAGKSTIAFGLSRRGYPLWADDVVAFEIEDGRSLALSLPFGIRLRAEVAELFDSDIITSNGPGSGRDLPNMRTAPLTTACVLRKEVGAARPVAVRRLSLTEAFAAILPHAFCFTLQDKERKRRMMHHYLDLVAGIPMFEVCFRSGTENLPAVLDAIERVLEENTGKFAADLPDEPHQR
jgi:hypothetical protein